MITIKEISKKYGRQQVLNNVSINFDAHQSVALIGPNGSGKTTLIKTILGMVIPDSGEVVVDGHVVGRDETYRKAIGYMPQISRFPENMSVKQLFQLMKDLRKEQAAHLDTELYETFKLNEFDHKKLKALSGGMRQKVSATLAFLFHPGIIILDEPTAGLDPLSVEMLKEKIRKESSEGKLILMTSHILSDLDEIITDVVYMQEGNLVFYDTLQDLKAKTGEENLSRAMARWMLEKDLAGQTSS